MDTLANVRRVGKRREKLLLQSEKLAEELRVAMIAAHKEGHSLRDIAKAAGVSHVRVLQIVGKEMEK